MNRAFSLTRLWNLNQKKIHLSISKRGRLWNRFPSSNCITNIFAVYCAATAPHLAHLENDILFVPEGMEVHQFPAIWLRDNCQCSKCFSEHAQARLVLMRNLDLNMKPSNVEDDGSKVFYFNFMDSSIKFSYDCWFISRLKSGGLMDMIVHSIDNGLLIGHLQV